MVDQKSFLIALIPSILGLMSSSVMICLSQATLWQSLGVSSMFFQTGLLNTNTSYMTTKEIHRTLPINLWKIANDIRMCSFSRFLTLNSFFLDDFQAQVHLFEFVRWIILVASKFIQIVRYLLSPIVIYFFLVSVTMPYFYIPEGLL